MNAKKAKKIRRQVKSYLDRKNMDSTPQDQGIQYSLKQLETYVQLHAFLMGTKPEKLVLVPSFYNYYVQEVQNQAEAMGLQQGFKDDNPTFLGIPVEKKIDIAVAK